MSDVKFCVCEQDVPGKIGRNCKEIGRIYQSEEWWEEVKKSSLKKQCCYKKVRKKENRK